VNGELCGHPRAIYVVDFEKLDEFFEVRVECPIVKTTVDSAAFMPSISPQNLLWVLKYKNPKQPLTQEIQVDKKSFSVETPKLPISFL